MTQLKQPDIEIYVKNLDADKLTNWLSATFECNPTAIAAEALLTRPQDIKLGYKGKIVVLTVTPNAAGKRYTSLWFKSDETPWKTDLECAEDFIRSTAPEEVRCSAGSWTESEPESSEQWWVLTDNEKKKVGWF